MDVLSPRDRIDLHFLLSLSLSLSKKGSTGEPQDARYYLSLGYSIHSLEKPSNQRDIYPFLLC